MKSASIAHQASLNGIHHSHQQRNHLYVLGSVPGENIVAKFQLARPLDISTVFNKDDLQEVLLAKARASITTQKNFTMVLQLLLPDGSTELRFRASFRQVKAAY